MDSSLGWVPIEHAGAGLWEALVSLSATLPNPGQVVFLDEPATHLHSIWQARLLRYLREHQQVVLVTHSPFLVPAEDAADFNRVTRLTAGDGGTSARGLGQLAVPDTWRDRWRQILAGSADARSVLFTRGVLLVEGETELGAFRRWFNDPAVVGDETRGLEGRNLTVLSVDGDWNFGPHVSYLERIGVAWAIVADGPALSPSYKHSLNSGLRVDPATEEKVIDLLGDPPDDANDFARWVSFWRGNGVFTVATKFGLKENGEKFSADSDESGEIEFFFRTLDSETWTETKRRFTSKVRRGYAFAETLDLTTHAEALQSISQLWAALLERLDPDHAECAE